ncbi:Zinc finger CCCH domain-containing protein 28 [Zea mays]|uniref:Zinc finger CCCH domain-containing protein 28 n=1 Tax=Zea mays TaxID=4577 RepID=A0A1D6J753_MAIZE|nr:Zinc finger CCCH domain-containing protein 28 [Zea mays]
MASAEIPNSSPDATNPAPAAAAATGPDLSSSPPPLPPRKRRLSPSPPPTRSASRSRSPRSRSPHGRRSRSRSRSPQQYPTDGKRQRHNGLTVDACRDFLRDRCTRSDLECRYAHPHNSVSIDLDNKVTACADSLRNNCFRGMTCRYYHPPPHIQEQLLRSVGVEDPKVKTICRDFTRGKCSRSANECRFLHHSSVEDVAILYMPPPPPPPLGVPMMGPLPSPPIPFADNTNRVEVCRDFLKNMCNRESCRFVHPETHTTAVNANVEVCRDFKRGECNRSACRFFHPHTS